MAEIEIERKKRPVWPWILLLVLVALIGWVVYEYMDDRNTTEALAAPETSGMMANAEARPLQRNVATV